MAKDKTTVSRSSSTVAGIPVAGAIAHGDSSYALGRKRRYPFYRDSMGSPSMSADTGISTLMSRVNKGWNEPEKETIMFPEQDDEEQDNYNIDDYVLPTTRKIPKQKIPKAVRESDRQMKQYKLSNILTDEFYLDDNLNELTAWKGAWEAAKSTAVDVGGDLSMAMVGSIPVVGDFIAASAALFNIGQMNGTMNRSKSHIGTFLQSPNQNTRNLLEEDLDDLITDLIDFVQRSLEAMPDPGATEIGSAGISLVSNLARLRFGKIGYEVWRKAKVAKGALSGFKGVAGPLPSGAAGMAATGAKVQKYTGIGGSGVGASAKVAVIVEPITRYIAGIFESDLVPSKLKDKSDSVLAVPFRMQLLADLVDDYDTQVASWYDNGVRPDRFDKNAMYRSRVSVNPSDPGGYQSTGSVLSKPIPPQEGSSGTSAQIPESKKINYKERKMSSKLLKQFILEALDLEAMGMESPYAAELGFNAHFDSYPMGYEHSNENQDFIEDFLVQIKSDVGTTVGQPRVSEAYLREFIREAVKKKKMKPRQ